MEKEQFGSRLGFILVSAGCAIGLGNVWKFPYICGENGGAAFIVIYLACLAMLGLPMLICEYAVGRGSGKSVMKAYDVLQPEGTLWSKVKHFCFAGNYLLMMFYTMVAGWMLHYVYLMITGKFVNADTAQVKDTFTNMLNEPGVMMFWTMVIILLCFGICALGLKNGVENITKVMMILLVVLMVVLVLRSVTLPGAEEGLKYYLVPDFKKLSEHGILNVIFAAMTHAFFTLSIGMGSMEIFGSYLSKERKLTGEALSVTILDTLIALMAGIIIIPSCFAYDVQPDAGPSLLYVTLPSVFNHMPNGRLWGTCFFIFMSFAAMSTVIAVFENIVKMTQDATEWERKKCVLVNLIGVAFLSIPAVLGYNILSGIQPLGAGSTIMDLEDFIVSYNILPLGSILFVLFCVRKNGWGWDNFVAEVNTGKGMSLSHKLRWYMNYIVPTLGILIYLGGYYDMFKKSSPAVFIMWMTIAVLLVAGILAIAFHKGKKTE
ncbi:MAG: sodium-dependent transporter [Lachnospira sp.]